MEPISPLLLASFSLPLAKALHNNETTTANGSWTPSTSGKCLGVLGQLWGSAEGRYPLWDSEGEAFLVRALGHGWPGPPISVSHMEA